MGGLEVELTLSVWDEKGLQSEVSPLTANIEIMN